MTRLAWQVPFVPGYSAALVRLGASGALGTPRLRTSARAGPSRTRASADRPSGPCRPRRVVLEARVWVGALREGVWDWCGLAFGSGWRLGRC